MKFEEEDMTMILLNSLLMSYNNLVTIMMWGKETLELEEIIGALLSFNQRKKASDGVHRVKGMWPRVIRSVGETSLGVSQVETNLDPNRGEGRIFNVISAGKRAHKTRMFEMEEREDRKQRRFVKVCECSRRRRPRER